VLYLHRESKREGYPLITDPTRNVRVVGFPDMPDAKTYRMAHGADPVVRPGKDAPEYEVAAKRQDGFLGSPLYPTGDPMVDGVGPAAWAIRPQIPDITHEGQPKIVPMRVATDYKVSKNGPDPRGKPVFGLDDKQAATVVDLWVDRSEPQIRYLELDADGRRILLPVTLSRIRGDGSVKVHSIKAEHFANVPTIANPDQVTLQEEDQICAYYGGGTLYATRERAEPII
jgi:photosynthetic reaction center H subunit